MSVHDVIGELMQERYGRPPTAELGRYRPEDYGDGGADTPDTIRRRRAVLETALRDAARHVPEAPHGTEATP